MFHYLKYYIAPILTLLIGLGILLGGNWMWLGFITFSIVVVGGDILIGEDTSDVQVKHTELLQLPLYLALPILIGILTVLAWATSPVGADPFHIGSAMMFLFSYDALAAKDASTGLNLLGAVIGVGFMVTGYGTNVAHELFHQLNSKTQLALGRWLMSLSCQVGFSIEHVFGHHKHVATSKDPATALRGENVYAFSIRSSIGGHLSAWRIEMNRLRKKGLPTISWHNRMLTGYLMSLPWALLFYYAGGILGLGIFFAQSLISKFVLEIVNYVEHYGLLRKTGERVGPQHSWNTNKRMSGMVLYSLTRHSAHHEKATIRFWKLSAYPDAPQLPYGYLTAIFVALVPPIWFSIIASRLKKWDTQYGTHI